MQFQHLEKRPGKSGCYIKGRRLPARVIFEDTDTNKLSLEQVLRNWDYLPEAALLEALGAGAVEVFEEVAQTRPMRAAVDLAVTADRWWARGKPEVFANMLRAFRPERVPGDAAVCFLGNMSRSAQDWGYADLFDLLAERALVWVSESGWSAEDIEDARRLMLGEA